MTDPTRRFSDRVADYLAYRPGYPQAVVADLVQTGVLTPTAIVADIGSGTGLLTELFLKNGNRVLGVEPNQEMRQAGEHCLRAYPQFVSVAGRAEETGLPTASVDLVAAGQAFHWFDIARARQEFARILKPPRWVVLVWNERLTDTTPFLAEYEQLLQEYGTDYAAVDHRQINDEALAGFFGPSGFTLKSYDNRQQFDLAGLRGRLLSSSYAPPADHPRHPPMLHALTILFEKHQVAGQVAFAYQTKLYVGRL